MSDTVYDILQAKKSAGEDSFLWLHSSGDCILWPNEESSINDDGRHALHRWRLNEDEHAALVAIGEVDELG